MGARRKQQEFKGRGFNKPKDAFGGTLLKGNPKTKRPLDSKMPIHLCLRAKRGGMRTPRAFGAIHDSLYRIAKKYGVKIYSYANVGNHIHVAMKVTKTRLWAAFIRELTSKIAAVTGRNASGEKFWKHRPFTRIIRGWRSAYQILKEYIYLNQLEAEGHIDRRQTKTIKSLRAIFDG